MQVDFAIFFVQAEEKAKREGRIEELDFQKLTREEAWEAMEEVMTIFMKEAKNKVAASGNDEDDDSEDDLLPNVTAST